MTATSHVQVRVDLARIRANAEAVRRLVGVPVLAVVKAGAYGLGAGEVAPVLSDLVDGFCFFSFEEAAAAGLWERLGKPSLTLGPPDADPPAYRRFQVRPAVATVAAAGYYREADPILSVDTGMQRFGCPREQVPDALRAGGCREAMTHATHFEQAEQLADLLGGRGLRLHAAASSLLDVPEARLDAVRPGLALYRGAARVTTRLLDVRDSTGPAGYTGFTVPRHGVIPAGYSNGLRPGPCLVNGHPSRVLEVGMQSAYVQCAPGDKAGDEVVLLGDALTEAEVAAAWGTPPHAVLLYMARMGRREYAGA
jgi:alanine racemase